MMVGQSKLHYHNVFSKGTDSDCLRYWAPSFILPKDHLLRKNTLLTTLPTLTKEWRVSFEFNPKSFNYNGYAQILQMTIGGKGGKVGDRTPALWIHKSKGVYIVTTLNGKANVGKFFPTNKLPIGKWSALEISQTKRGTMYMFSFLINSETVWTQENTKPKQFSDVHVFASSGWYVAQAGFIRGFKIENMIPGIKNRNSLTFLLLTLVGSYFLSTNSELITTCCLNLITLQPLLPQPL